MGGAVVRRGSHRKIGCWVSICRLGRSFSVCFLCTCVGFLQVLWLPFTGEMKHCLKTCMLGKLVILNCPVMDSQ